MTGITNFPVANGDMALVFLQNGQRLLVDVNIRGAACDPDDEAPDVVSALRERLRRDDLGRLYVDGFLLTHPDRDHVLGLEEHFHLGPPASWSRADDKILIREMWSSPIIFRRKRKKEALCADAEAWVAEARRRVARFRADGMSTGSGDRILVLGEDMDDKTSGLDAIKVAVDGRLQALDRVVAGAFEARLLGPLPPSDDEDEEEKLAKNRSSIVMQLTIAADSNRDACRLLIGGDAGVGIWERLWARHGSTNPGWLSYDLLVAPHHCSWRSLSHDSYSELGERARVSPDARAALGQARSGARIVASSRTISPNDADPPSHRAKREYVGIVGAAQFVCTTDAWKQDGRPLEFEIGRLGTARKAGLGRAAIGAVIGVGATAAHPRPHGSRGRG